MRKGLVCPVLLVYVIFLIEIAQGKVLLPIHTIDKACSVGSNSGNTNMKKTLEMWSGSKIPLDSLPGDTKLFTGFKVHRVFNFHQLYRQSSKALKITYCNEGKVVFDTEKQITSDTKDWSHPWCFFESGESQESNGDLNNLHCLKIARRKKYAVRPFDLFVPYTWVGGLFYCDIDSTAKQLISTSLRNDQVDTDDMKEVCSLSNSIPIQPLYASTYSDSWTEVVSKRLVPFVTLLSKRKTRTYVPYLHTPNLSMGLGKFSLSSYSSNVSMSQLPELNGKLSVGELLMGWFSKSKGDEDAVWFQEIEVSEKYHYNNEDSFKLSLATQKLKEMVAPFIQSFPDEQRRPALHLRALNIITKGLWKSFGITDKLLSANLTKILDKCWAFLRYWDNMNVSKESFQYIHP
ncbi:unnamed protein product [Kluyveromyces dobzhanskii CBS 2104]|uniref:WGS project CCBQ000000000 data, contig 00016 n=1 Tax=Kluyveromyces dobzhanskii CBS 2104 TaxID=1427455 RepID=A0A0A8KZT0_9SACH|nr:unnamed protein product [Kluyveromyces dobzhanskii CBS 2104]